MKRVFAICSLLACLAGLAAAGFDWKPYKSKAGRFSAVFPQAPATMTMPFEERGVRLNIHMVLAPIDKRFQEDADSAYMVIYTDLPAAHMDASEPETVLDRFLTSYIKSRSYKLISSRSISTDKLPGREFVYKEPSKGLVGLARVFLRGDRLYMPIILYKDGQPVPSELNRFFSSFKIG